MPSKERPYDPDRTAELLIELFTTEELRDLLRRYAGKQVTDALPGERSSSVEVARTAVDILRRRGLLDDEFFQLIVRERPRRLFDIEVVTGPLTPATKVDASPTALPWRRVVLASLWAVAGLGLVTAVVRTGSDGPGPLSAYPAFLVLIVLGFGVQVRDLATAWYRKRVRAVTRVAPKGSDPELGAATTAFFSRAGRTVRVAEPGVLHVPEVAVLAAYTPARPEDAHRLRPLLGPDERAFFIYRGALPERVADILDSHRLEGHPIAAVSYEALRAAVTDDASARFLGELEHSNFKAQNLYEKKNALWDERHFFGRENLLTEIGSAVAGGDSVLLTGLRKAGKSSFLNILRQHMIFHAWCHVDMQRFAGDATNWPLTVARELVDAIDRWGATEFLGAWPSDLPKPQALSGLSAALEARRAWVHARGRKERPILVLDEVERVFSTTDPALADRIVEAGVFRAESQAGPWLTVLAADLRPVLTRTNQLPNGKTNPFYSFLRVVPVRLFTPEATDRMVRTIGRAMGIREVDDAFVRALHAYTGGHPGLARTVAAAARTVQASPQRLTLEDLQRGLNRLHQDNELGSFFSQNIWSPATPIEQGILTWLATQAAPVTAVQAPAELQDQEAWASLTAQGILTVTDVETPAPRYTLAMGGLLDWLKAKARREQALRGSAAK